MSGCPPLGEAFIFSVGPPHIPAFLPIGLDYAPLFMYFPKSFWPPRINPSLYQFIRIHTKGAKGPLYLALHSPHLAQWPWQEVWQPESPEQSPSTMFIPILPLS